jgi:hypothetical protein
VDIDFPLELSLGETVDPGVLFGKCNLAFPGKKEELGNFLRIFGTTPDISFSEALKSLSPFGMLFGSGLVNMLLSKYKIINSTSKGTSNIFPCKSSFSRLEIR